MSDNKIEGPHVRPPRDLLEMWQEVHKNDWRALLRPKPFEADYRTTGSDVNGADIQQK